MVYRGIRNSRKSEKTVKFDFGFYLIKINKNWKIIRNYIKIQINLSIN